jgi:hypothetical protein
MFSITPGLRPLEIVPCIITNPHQETKIFSSSKVKRGLEKHVEGNLLNGVEDFREPYLELGFHGMLLSRLTQEWRDFLDSALPLLPAKE